MLENKIDHAQMGMLTPLCERRRQAWARQARRSCLLASLSEIGGSFRALHLGTP